MAVKIRKQSHLPLMPLGTCGLGVALTHSLALACTFNNTSIPSLAHITETPHAAQVKVSQDYGSASVRGKR